MKKIVLAALAACLYARAQTPAPLQVNLDHLTAKAKESVEVTLDSSMLQRAGRFLSGDKREEAQAKELIAGWKGILVRSFEFERAGEYSAADLEPLREQLRAPGWSRLVNVHSKSEGETLEIYSKTESGRSAGLAVIAAEPKELTVVFIDGPVDLSRLSDLGGRFGIPANAVPQARKKGTK